MANTKFSDPQELEADLIAYICKKAQGVGETTSRTIAGLLESVEAFMQCTEDELSTWANVLHKPILKPHQANEIIAIRDRFMQSDSPNVRQLWITTLIREFIWNTLREIGAISITQLPLNPFLIRAGNFTDHQDVIRLCFYQQVTHIIEASWNDIVEDLQYLLQSKEFSKPDFNNFFVGGKEGTSQLLRGARNGMPSNTDYASILREKEQQLVQEWETIFGTGIHSIVKVVAQTL